MPDWSETELTRIGAPEELKLASRRRDGTLRPCVTMWVVRAGDNIYVRSAYGPNNPWFRRAKARGTGRIRAGGVERDVTFNEAAPEAHPAIDAAYHAKYDRHGPRLVEQLAEGWEPPLNLSPVTTEFEQARQWSEQLHPTGVERLVVKGAAHHPAGGVRQWLKVKHRDTIDLICAAVIGSRTQPDALVLGLLVDGQLRIVGRTASLRGPAARALTALLRPPVGEHPWPAHVKPGTLDRFNSGGRELIDLTLVEPFVVEISADRCEH